MASKRFKDNAWRYTIKRKGLLPKPINLTFHDEAEGDKYVFKLEQLLNKGIVPEEFAKNSSALLGEVIKLYKQMTAVKTDDSKLLESIRTDFSTVPLEDITYPWTENWVRKLKREKNLAPSTIRHYVGALARCLDWALAHEYIKTNPVRFLPVGYAQYNQNDSKFASARQDIEKDRRLEPGEEEAIREKLDGEMLLYFEIALETAMRLSEIYSLTLDQIDINRRTIFLDKTKNGQKRQVPITTPLLKILESLKEFPTYSKSEKNSARLSKRFSRQVSEVAPGFTFHCLRHEATSRLFERTQLSEFKIMKITGHSSVRMLARYANLRASNLADELW